jgi:hypothetical protein
MLGLCVGLLPPMPAHALTPLELFEEGNRLYRDELYWAAILRYEQAGEAGLAIPLLHFNTGVAHYRARQYERAREALLLALDSPELGLAAQYNLGLTEYAAGDNEAALRWLRLVRDQQQSRKLAAYATEAIARIRVEELGGIEEVEAEQAARAEVEVAKFELYGKAGFGTDTNPYRTPSQSYVDYSQPGAPFTSPTVHSGAYIPFEVGVKYRVNAYENEGFFGAYRLAGHTYADVALNDADEYAHEISIGSEYRARDDERDREREIYSAFSFAQHQEFYFDPDTATYFSFVDEDGQYQEFPQRMDYVRYGPEINWRQTYSKITVGLGFKGQIWNYENEDVVPEYDHEYLVLTGFGQYKFTPSSLIRVAMKGSRRHFGERPAYNLDGEVLPGNPDLEYDYAELELTARQRITNRMWFGLEYNYSQRTDNFEGYNDYIRDRFGVDFRWRIGHRFDFSVTGSYMLYDFENAFAYNDPSQPRKTLEIVDVEGELSFRLTEHIYIVADANFYDSASNDIRINYDRAQYALGVRWSQ